MGVSTRVPDRAITRSLRIRGELSGARLGSAGVVAVVAACFAVVIASGDASQRVASVTVVAMVPAAVIDLRERRLPDRWVAFAAAVLAATAWAAWVTGQSIGPSSMLLGAAVLAGPILLLHLVSPHSMGFGDVKASIVLGAAVGWADWGLAVAGLALAAGLAATIGIVGRRRTIPFGPFLVMGSAIALASHAFTSMGATP